MTTDRSRRLILLTGAAGRIGSAFFAATREQYRFRLADRSVETLSANCGIEVMRLNVADLDACRDACRGVDTVVHLAADPSAEADFYDSLLENNLLGTYNIFRAAAEAGCRRVVYASSLHAIAGHPPGSRITEEAPVRPINMYGASKCFGEATASAFVAREGLSAIAVRIGAYEAPWIAQDQSPLNLSAFISARDLNHLLVQCVETPNIDFAIVHAISDNTIKRVDITETRRLLRYEPQDDGFGFYSDRAGDAGAGGD